MPCPRASSGALPRPNQPGSARWPADVFGAEILEPCAPGGRRLGDQRAYLPFLVAALAGGAAEALPFSSSFRSSRT